MNEWWVISTGFVPLFLGPIGIVFSCLTEINSLTWIPIQLFTITLRKNHINPENRKKESSNKKNNKMYNHSQSQVPPLTNNNHNQHTNNPYIIISPDPTSSYSSCKRPIDRMFDALSRCGKRVEYATRKAEAIADDVWHHLTVSPSLTDAAMARLAQGTKVLAEGGLDHAFQQAFNILPGEELLNSYACYLSTTSGPVIGMLYLSTKRVAFCSDYSFCCYSSTGQPEWMYYKMVVQLDQLRAVKPSANRLNPSEKYIHIVTRDGYEFWFMGFISYDKALKKLTEALQRACNSSGVVSRV